MNELELASTQDLIKEEEDLPSLWKRTKQEQNKINSYRRRLNGQIDSEVAELNLQRDGEIAKQRASEGEKVRALLDSIDNDTKKASSGFGIFCLVALPIAAILIILKVLIPDFVIVNPFLTYLVLIAVSIVVGIIATVIRKNKLKNAIELAESNEGVKAYRVKESNINKEYGAKIIFVQNEKYAEEKREIDDRDKANRYNEVRNAMIKYTYGDCLFINFEGLGSHCSCEIKLNGATVRKVSRKDAVMVNLNTGYTAVELNFVYHQTYSDGTWHHSEATVNFQASQGECPVFVTCSKYTGNNTYWRKLTCDEFEEITGKAVIC